jgi:hypothetical protein
MTWSSATRTLTCVSCHLAYHLSAAEASDLTNVILGIDDTLNLPAFVAALAARAADLAPVPVA